VKVDNQAVLEGVATGQGGRIALTKAYRRALESSVRKHFRGNLINCMANAQETWYGSTDSTLTRSSIDFFPTRPETHTEHIYANAQVGLWFGEFMHPDWDMFQSPHEWGAYHAAARAVCGGPVYVSDKPGQHDVELLKKLVCSDGSVLRADAPALPTLDTLLVDPTREARPFKIWNRNGPRGVLAAFNAKHTLPGQGTVTGDFGPEDVVGISGERFACYAHGSGELSSLALSARKPFVLASRGFEIYTFAPVERGFGAIGLADKFNSGAAIVSQSWSRAGCELSLRDGGTFVAYAEQAPARVNNATGPLHFGHDAASGKLQVELPTAGPQVLEIHW
jgi:raffinose synthase